MNNRTNILFTTTKCNLFCSYCYEEASRDGLPEQIEMSEEIIDNYLNEISEREKDCISTVVIMGGEVFLKPKLLKYIINKMSSMKHKWGVCITTNATLIKEDFLKKLYLEKGNNTFITFEISYDCSGHYRRIFRESKKSTKKIVENTADMFVKNNIPFKFSYTLHKDNYNNFVKDMIYMCERWGKNDNLIAIKLSPFFQELYENFGDDSLEKLEPYAHSIYNRYKIGICNFSCNMCKKCDKSNFIGNAYFSPKGDKIQYEPYVTKKNFDRWI